jgi:hypothetical protein
MLRSSPFSGRTPDKIASPLPTFSANVPACLFAILDWILHHLKTSPRSLLIFLSLLIVAFVLEDFLQRYRADETWLRRACTSVF